MSRSAAARLAALPPALLLLAPLAPAQDFDGDGLGDLAAGAPYESVGALEDCGAVGVRYGDGDLQHLVQPPSPWNSGPEAEALFGRALAWGDFDGDGFDDLAVGAPGASVSGALGAGVVTVFRGSKSGLVEEKGCVLSQDTFGVQDVAEPSDDFGRSLATGDFDGDGIADLAIGAPAESSPLAERAGIVHVLFGQVKAGLTGDGSIALQQGADGLLEKQEPHDLFGLRLAAGDFRGDGYDDLAVGVPFEDVYGYADAGLVQVVPFHAGLVDLGSQQLWHQAVTGVHDDLESYDQFGWSLAAGDFHLPGLGTDDPACDLAIGVPGEDPDGVPDAGAVHVLFGRADEGLAIDFTWLFHQGMNDAWGEKPEPGDLFGFSLAAPRRWDGTASLAIGVPFEDLETLEDAGVVHVLTRRILVYWFDVWELESLTLTQDDLIGAEEQPETGDRFGHTLARYGVPDAGEDLDDHYADNGRLAIGVPFEDAGKVVDAGQVDAGWLVGGSFAGLRYWQHDLDPVEVPEPGDRLGFGL